MSEDRIEFEFVQTNVYRRRPCTLCGGATDKVDILTEARWPCGNILTEALGGVLRVCESCLKAGNIDERLELRAQKLEAQAVGMRYLIGQLKMPSFEDWLAMSERANIAWCAQDETGSRDVYKKVMEDDAFYHVWRQNAKDRLESGEEPRCDSNPEDLDLPF